MQYVVAFLCGLAGAIIFTFGYNKLYHQSIGIVRIDQIISEHVQEIGKSELPKEELDDRAKRFGAALEDAISSVSSEYKVTLLVAPAVVTTMPDYTNSVRELIKQRLSSDE